MMEKGKESEFPEGRGGGKGLEILRISEEPGVPPTGNRRFPEREGYSEAAGNLSEAKGSLK